MAPVFFTAKDEPLHLQDHFKGGHCFLVLGGKSILDNDLELLKNPSILTMGVNNSPVTFRPNFWTMVDDVKNFVQSIYTDTGIMKFLPHPKRSHKLWDNFAWKESKTRVQECPNVAYYKREDTTKNPFNAKTFLTDNLFCWGNHNRRCSCGWMREEKVTKCLKCGHPKFKRGKCRKCQWERPTFIKLCPECGVTDEFGCRSVMLVAIRILYELGFRHVYLLGADFKMVEGEQNYSFAQARSKTAVNNNNSSYRIMNKRFDALRPVFEAKGFHVYNCNKESGLKSFEYLSYEDSLTRALAHIPEVEKSEGMYDRKANEEDARKKEVKEVPEGAAKTFAEFIEKVGAA